LIDALRERSPNGDVSRASHALLAAFPVGRPFEITQDIVDAAISGNLGLLATLLAEEDEPEPDELELLREASKEDDGSLATFDEVWRELGLPNT